MLSYVDSCSEWNQDTITLLIPNTSVMLLILYLHSPSKFKIYNMTFPCNSRE